MQRGFSENNEPPKSRWAGTKTSFLGELPYLRQITARQDVNFFPVLVRAARIFVFLKMFEPRMSVWLDTYLQRRVQRQVGVQQVLWFQVTMDNPVTVQILKHRRTWEEPTVKADPLKVYLEQ
ncbi:hypothetical protein XENOCAPTIV_027891 [Xenoophorus captivus]|uniref:Uncharacterized protein n=1 Tax=Xenoophorus captivus TaxID=1517983 RepID=A0ABV0QEV1_9TELE